MDPVTRQTILDLIHTRPQAVNEIATAIGKNWRTADRYLQQLAHEDLIDIHVFRKGGRGALKVAYWPSDIARTPSAAKRFLFERISTSAKKDDFSCLDIIQHVPKQHRTIESMTQQQLDSEKNKQSFMRLLKSAKSTILLFSGNLSFLTINDDFAGFLKLIDSRLAEGIDIRILTRIDLTNDEMVQQLLKMNTRGHPGTIEIRAALQPLRVTVIDESVATLKEDFELYRKADKYKSLPIHIYTISEPTWSRWLASVFWHIWHGSVDAQRRLEIINEIVHK